MSDIDIIYTTSGPYSDHLIGYMLKKNSTNPGLPILGMSGQTTLMLNMTLKVAAIKLST